MSEFANQHKVPHNLRHAENAEIRKLKYAPAFQAASQEILRRLKEHGDISIEHVLQELSKCEASCDIISNFFPGAKDSQTILDEMYAILEPLGVTEANTLFCQSVCPDEINHEQGDITSLFFNHFGEVFHLGGLAGVPFTGKTGFAAYSHHIPDNGNLFILFAPHIGLSDRGVLGEYSRKGQEGHPGSACGAAVGAFKHCLECKPIPTNESLGANPFDYQMCYIISEVNKRISKIKDENPNKQQANLAFEMYNICKDFLNEIVSLDVGHTPTKIFILGGIQINMPPPLSDFFQPLMFEVRCKGQPTVDLMHAFDE